MGTTTAQTVDVAQVLAGLLAGVPGARTAWWVSDAIRPPCIVIGQPDIDFTDTTSPFCFATWLFPLTIVTPRANDRDVQRQMSQLVIDVVTALGADDTPLFSVEPLDARPLAGGVAIGGNDLPAYMLNVRIRA
jgi:hypothetical protein